MNIKDLSTQFQINIVRDYVANGAKYSIEKYNITYDDLVKISMKVRKEIKKDWCLQNNAFPVDFDMLMCIARWCPSEKKYKNEFLSFFKSCKKDYRKLIKTVDTTLYKMPANIPTVFKVCVVEGLKKSKYTTDMINVLAISRKTLRKWQTEVNNGL